MPNPGRAAHEEQLIQIREAGLRQVPLIFLCIGGENEKVKRGDETVEAGGKTGAIWGLPGSPGMV